MSGADFTRRSALALAAGAGVSAFAPSALRRRSSKRALWERSTGPHLRGAVFSVRRTYADLDGPQFLGPGLIGPPVSDRALDQLAEAGANLASWSGPGLYAEHGSFALDTRVLDHIGAWLDRCLARGLYTTLCFRSGPGRSAFAFHPEETWYPAALYDDSLWRSADKQAAWADMVAETFTQFGGHRALAGVLAVEEPNAADLGLPGASVSLSRQVLRRVRRDHLDADTPLLLSPDRWARAEAASDLRAGVGEDVVLIIHSYEPWAYTHQAPDDNIAFTRRDGHSGYPELSGDWALLEFGAVRHAPAPEAYFADRIAAWERAGANWAAFRWTTDWTIYEAREGAMTVSDDARLLALLRQAFQANQRRPA